ncbi:hypothetical protein ABZ490_26665 [Streptomyces sp. NPDC005811]|uniref:hypothetical protein n=1 Tax=Streptomyces sp. NPDC005811 TaxID=3154565 RepID=UPI0033F18A7F
MDGAIALAMEKDLLKHFAPLPDRTGQVGSIESLTLDGHRYYFGFDYKSDVVLSPLIDDPKAMAAFASEYMRQTTGGHDVTYWEGLVHAAAEGTELDCDDAERDIASRDLRGDVPGRTPRVTCSTFWARLRDGTTGSRRRRRYSRRASVSGSMTRTRSSSTTVFRLSGNMGHRRDLTSGQSRAST